jgi:putative tricarboxylic transport membrane protein
VIGSFAIQSRIFEIGVMVVFGLLGYLMKEMDYPVAPLVLGIILGDILDKNLRRALVITDGNILPLFTRPISLIIVLLTLFTIVSRMRWFTSFVAAAKGQIRSFFGRGRSPHGK